MEVSTESSSNADTSPHWIRITSYGKIRVWVAFALKSLQDNPSRPLVFHTLPASLSGVTPTSTANLQVADEDPQSKSQDINGESPSGDHRCTAMIPRLVTVVEIIKREYNKQFQKTKVTTKHPTSVDIPTPSSVLHQYNEVGSLEDMEGNKERTTNLEDPHHERTKYVLQALEETSAKIKRTPYMKVTLSVRPLDEAEKGRATYQPPAPPKKVSKAAQHRAKKRAGKKVSALTSSNPSSEIRLISVSPQPGQSLE